MKSQASPPGHDAAADPRRLWGPNGEWSGLGPDDSLPVTRDIGSPEIYALDWQP